MFLLTLKQVVFGTQYNRSIDFMNFITVSPETAGWMYRDRGEWKIYWFVKIFIYYFI